MLELDITDPRVHNTVGGQVLCSHLHIHFRIGDQSDARGDQRTADATSYLV